jgi:hypothetical protein
VDIGADVHLLTAALQSFAVAEALCRGCDIQVVDARIDAGADHVGAVLGDVLGHLLVGKAVPVSARIAVLPVPA